jgi:hypothetical protein
MAAVWRAVVSGPLPWRGGACFVCSPIAAQSLCNPHATQGKARRHDFRPRLALKARGFAQT